MADEADSSCVEGAAAVLVSRERNGVVRAHLIAASDRVSLTREALTLAFSRMEVGVWLAGFAEAALPLLSFVRLDRRQTLPLMAKSQWTRCETRCVLDYEDT